MMDAFVTKRTFGTRNSLGTTEPVAGRYLLLPVGIVTMFSLRTKPKEVGASYLDSETRNCDRYEHCD